MVPKKRGGLPGERKGRSRDAMINYIFERYCWKGKERKRVMRKGGGGGEVFPLLFRLLPFDRKGKERERKNQQEKRGGRKGSRESRNHNLSTKERGGGKRGGNS